MLFDLNGGSGSCPIFEKGKNTIIDRLIRIASKNVHLGKTHT
jgi:hypothetical protein